VWLWFATIAALLAVFGLDLFWSTGTTPVTMARPPAGSSLRQRGRGVGLLVWVFAGVGSPASSSPVTSPSTRCRWTTVRVPVIMTAFAYPSSTSTRAVGRHLIALVLRTR